MTLTKLDSSSSVWWWHHYSKCFDTPRSCTHQMQNTGSNTRLFTMSCIYCLNLESTWRHRKPLIMALINLVLTTAVLVVIEVRLYHFVIRVRQVYKSLLLGSLAAPNWVSGGRVNTISCSRAVFSEAAGTSGGESRIWSHELSCQLLERCTKCTSITVTGPK